MVKTREVEVLVVKLDVVATKERVVSGPERVKGPETSSVRVYGGPYAPLARLVLERIDVVRAHRRSGVLLF